MDFNGYKIPKNSHVIPLLHAVHMDPDTWENPSEFRPERFLSPDGSQLVKPDHFMPFSVGQRMCMGDQLAEKELFLFFSSLLHTFHLEKASSSSELPDLVGVAAVTVTPKPFQLVCVPRNLQALASSTQNMLAKQQSQPSCRTYG